MNFPSFSVWNIFWEGTIRYMSGFKGRVKTDISRWHTTKYPTILPVGCLPCDHRFSLLPTHGDIFGGTPPRYVRFPVKIKSWHRCTIRLSVHSMYWYSKTTLSKSVRIIWLPSSGQGAVGLHISQVSPVKRWSDFCVSDTFRKHLKSAFRIWSLISNR